MPTAGVSTSTRVLYTPLVPWNVSAEEHPLTALTPQHGWIEFHSIQMMILCALWVFYPDVPAQHPSLILSPFGLDHL